MKYSNFAVGELFKTRKGRKASQLIGFPAKDSKRYVQINDLRSDENLQYTDDSNGVEVLPSDICIAWDGANAGTIGYGLHGYIGSTIARLRPTDSDLVYSPYVGRFLQSKFQLLNTRTTGATIPHVSKDFLTQLEIPLPNKKEQKRIAAILDKADAIRRKRRQAIQLANEFLRSVFLDMFGDPVINPNKWPESKLDQISEIVSGVTKGRKFTGKKTTFVPYMRVANVQDGHINIDDVQEIEVLEPDVDKYRLEKGDILLTEGGDPDKLGRGAVWRGKIDPCIHQNHIFRVRTNSRKVLPDFLSALIGSSRGKRYFLMAAKQTTGVASINKTQLRNFPSLVPTINLQHKYLKVIKKVSELTEKNIEKAKQLDQLFNSLTQKAFRGEL